MKYICWKILLRTFAGNFYVYYLYTLTGHLAKLAATYIISSYFSKIYLFVICKISNTMYVI